MALVNVKRYRVPCVLNTVAYATSIPYWGSSGGVLAGGSTHDSGHPEPGLVAHGKIPGVAPEQCKEQYNCWSRVQSGKSSAASADGQRFLLLVR